MDIRVENAVKHFEGKQVLGHVSLVFPEGEISCLMGHSGIGKTTLLNVLMGFVALDAGSVSGVPDKVAAVFQEDRLLEPFSALDNLRFVLGKKADAALMLSHLTELGLTDGDMDQPVSTLSGGMRRRVAIARAVLYDAGLLLLDEAFKGLDDQTRRAAIGYVRKHTRGKTVIAVTHEMEEARLLGGHIVMMG